MSLHKLEATREMSMDYYIFSSKQKARQIQQVTKIKGPQQQHASPEV